MQVREVIAAEMASERAESGELYGIDVSDLDSARDYDPRTFVEQLDIVQRVNHYRILRRAQEELNSYAADVSLSEQERAARMCEVGLEAWKALDARFLHTLRQISVHADPGRARTLAEDTEASHLAGQIATRTSLYWNVRLRQALDEIREHHKHPRRERFEALLRELYSHGPQVWDEHHETDWQLKDTRREVAEKIVRQADSPPMEQQVAKFAVLEELRRLEKKAGLAPREHELFSLAVGEPERYLRRDGKLKSKEVAKEMGLKVGSVKSLWSRVRKKLTLVA